MFAAIKIDLASGDIKGIKLALKLDVELAKLDKGSRKGINFFSRIC